MSPEPLDELYFKWLYRQVAPLRLTNPARTYAALLSQLHSKEFVWFVPNDDNRVMDGLELRYEFLREINEAPGVYQDWLELGCSMFEMLLALSRRLSFADTSGRVSSWWFWHMIDNLGMRGFVDATPGSHSEIDDIMQCVIDRTYNSNGSGGGLFPLRETNLDQRGVELWYQMNYYLNERG